MCGSTHHPGTGPIEATVTVLEEQQRQQSDRHAELQKRETTEKARAAARVSRVHELAKEVERWQGELGRAADQWRSHGGAGDVLGTESKGWLEALVLEVAAESKAIAEHDQASVRLRRTAADARKSQEVVAGRVDKARSSLKAAESTLASMIGKRNDAIAEVSAHRKVLDATVENLTHAFAEVDGWQLELEANPKDFVAKWSARVEEARQSTQFHENSSKQLTEFDTQLELQANAMKQSSQHREALDVDRRQQASQRDAFLAQRREVLQGRPAAEVEAALQAALKASDQAHAAAAEQAKRTREEAAKRGEAHKIAAQEVTKCAQANELAAKALAEALSADGLDAATLRARLAHEEHWIREERAALTEMDRMHTSESKAVEERNKDLSAHEAQTAPELPLTEIEASLAALEPLHGEQSQQLGAAKQRLEQDNQNRAIGDAKARELERARKEATVWQQLDALIGSADGRKFRKFAQSMTMEMLLGHANAELANLAPRYLLQRVKSQDLELQVCDRDMGDEIRSTASLSGGETFLVSLALALGLSSLASEKVRIESLFIDEGFGSLDPKSLETALSTLDSLQSAGRKVGLISHVPGLAERIGVQVLVERQGQGASTVRVVSGSM